MTSDGPWTVLRRFTDARIGLGRAGSALPIREVLNSPWRTRRRVMR